VAFVDWITALELFWFQNVSQKGASQDARHPSRCSTNSNGAVNEHTIKLNKLKN